MLSVRSTPSIDGRRLPRSSVDGLSPCVAVPTRTPRACGGWSGRINRVHSMMMLMMTMPRQIELLTSMFDLNGADSLSHDEVPRLIKDEERAL